MAVTDDPAVHEFFRAAPGGVPTQVAFSQDRRYESLDVDRAGGVIRDRAHAFSQDGGLAVLHGNIALDGCVVKTAGVPEAVWQFTGTARVFESQDDAVAGILDKTVTAGDVVVIAGTDLAHVVKTTVFLKSMGDFAAMNGVYARHFPEPFPARSTVEVGALPKGGVVEIECVAVIN